MGLGEDRLEYRLDSLARRIMLRVVPILYRIDILLLGAKRQAMVASEMY